VVVLVATASFGCDKAGVLENREVLGDCLAGRADSVLHDQTGADLEQGLVVPIDEFVEDRSACRVVQCLVQLC
jgi:hypothetical protein